MLGLRNSSTPTQIILKRPVLQVACGWNHALVLCEGKGLCFVMIKEIKK